MEVETAVNGIRVRSDEKGESLNEEMKALMNKLKDANDKTEQMMQQVLSREAEILSITERLANMETRLEGFDRNPFSEDFAKSKPRGILNNPGLKHLEAYSGDHSKFSRWRSKAQGVLVSEDELYGTMLKTIEGPHQVEILPKSEGVPEYEIQIKALAKAIGTENY